MNAKIDATSRKVQKVYYNIIYRNIILLNPRDRFMKMSGSGE